MKVTLTVNGEQHEATIWPGESLLAMLRDRLGLPGSKYADRNHKNRNDSNNRCLGHFYCHPVIV